MPPSISPAVPSRIARTRSYLTCITRGDQGEAVMAARHVAEGGTLGREEISGLWLGSGLTVVGMSVRSAVEDLEDHLRRLVRITDQC